MDEAKNKFRGEFRKVDISSVRPNDWNPKEKIEDNEENMARYEEIKTNIAKKSLYLPIIVRTYQDGYQIVDGYHRWRGL
jgi:ParB-like chromosome segregation protein Spo0J